MPYGLLCDPRQPAHDSSGQSACCRRRMLTRPVRLGARLAVPFELTRACLVRAVLVSGALHKDALHVVEAVRVVDGRVRSTAALFDERHQEVVRLWFQGLVPGQS